MPRDEKAADAKPAAATPPATPGNAPQVPAKKGYQRERIAALERERDRLRWELEAAKTNIERFLKAGGMR